jgi:hypothetical protein
MCGLIIMAMAKVCVRSGFGCLPPKIFRLILQYLHIPSREIRALERAILNHELRSLYLQSLHGMTIKEYRPYRSYCSNLIQDTYWLLKKNLRILKINVTEHQDGILFLIYRSRLNLTSLSIDFSRFPSVFPSELARIGQFPSLTSISFISWPKNSASDFVSLCSKNPQIQSLRINRSDFSRDIFSRFFPCGDNLIELDVSRCVWFTDECVQSLIVAAPKLQSLQATDTKIQSLQSIQSILNSYPSLKYLSLESCNSLSREAQNYFIREYCVPRLRSSDPEHQVLGLNGIGEFVKWVSGSKESPPSSLINSSLSV